MDDNATALFSSRGISLRRRFPPLLRKKPRKLRQKPRLRCDPPKGQGRPQKLHTEVKVELKKAKYVIIDLQVKVDTTTSECDHLADSSNRQRKP